mmetsp:Transcript_117920/g.328516  ORF Transcript_117920/g.328516 Transcript_117920/m.328516 type:complete len:258 (+) Transcript_117920:424-1197(+)
MVPHLRVPDWCPMQWLINREAPIVKVNTVELYWVGRPNESDLVDQPHEGHHILGAKCHHRLRSQDAYAVYPRSELNARSDAHVGRQVRRVNLELAADSPLDRPATVEAETQVDAAVRPEPLLQPRVEPVVGEHDGPVDSSEDLGEGEDGHVSELPHLGLGHPGGAPDDQEGVAVVLVRSPVELVDNSVHYLRDLIDELHDLLLQHLRGGAEIAYPCIAHDALHTQALDHRVHARSVGALHVLAHDVGSGLSEAERQQ